MSDVKAFLMRYMKVFLYVRMEHKFGQLDLLKLADGSRRTRDD